MDRWMDLAHDTIMSFAPIYTILYPDLAFYITELKF